MFHFGVDYYPEHWPEERWVVDAQLMQEAGINTARLAEFAWSRIEIEDGRFDFGWLDRAIDILHKHQIKVVLGTPTASAPPWLLQPHPDLFRLREDGRRVTFGNRRGYCPNNLLYRQFAHRIVEQMADHYHDHPAVIGWQIDNEMGERCFCPVCQRSFHNWLKERYQCVETLNQKWGAVFWSHEFRDWEEIPVPLETGGSPNPSLAIDYYRFMSDSYVDFQQCQIEVIRNKCPAQWITHNFMGFSFDQLNYFDLARNLDLVSLNHYPRSQWSTQPVVDPAEFALALDTIRGLKHQNFWMMEQQAGPGGWEMISIQPRPGELRLWAYQSIAHGADGILFFRWRSCRYGAEQFWHGLLDHDGTPGRRYAEIKNMGQELKWVGNVLAASRVRPTVALMMSYDTRFAFQIQPNNPRFSYTAHFMALYQAFYRRHISIEIVSPADDLSAYRLVVAPSLHLINLHTAENLEEFVRQGGVLAMTQRTGVKDETNLVVNQRLPGYLQELLGIEVEEYDSLAPGMENEVRFDLPGVNFHNTFTCGILCDVLRLTTAEVVATYTRDYYAGKPAISENRSGAGRAFYIGTIGNADLYNTLAGLLLERANVDLPGISGDVDVEIEERWLGSRRLIFVLNFSDQTREISVDKEYSQLIGDLAVRDGKIQIPPRQLLVLE